MTARPLAMLDYINYKADRVLTKHAKNRPLGSIEQRYNYIPAQPVLSCRTVNIDLSGTRTYRPRSSDDILKEQQRLVRRLYGKHVRPSTGVSRPNTRLGSYTSLPASRQSSDIYGIEVRGRPLTSLSSNYSPRETNSVIASTARRKTKGRYTKVQPVTDCYLRSEHVKDFLSTNRSIREVNQQISTYWETGQDHLAQGIFRRGRPPSDEVPLKLNAWLTFGGAGGSGGGDGVIDAFTNFKSTEEYYNIEGTVGSQVAKQLQKGDAIRIGINGDVTARDLKVRKKSVRRSAWKKNAANQEDKVSSTSADESDESWQELIDFDSKDNFKEGMESERDVVTVSSFPESDSTLGKKLGNNYNSQMTSPSVVPLSWNDQCTKSDVKILKPHVTKQDCIKLVSSETKPVKFEKLKPESESYKIIQTPNVGYKIKQRPNTSTMKSSHKLKVVYVDTLTKEEDEKVQMMSIDDIVNAKFGHQNKKFTLDQPAVIENGHTNSNKVDKVTASNLNSSITQKVERKSSQHSTTSSLSGADHSHMSNTKLKTVPVHSVLSQPLGDLSISAPNSQQADTTKANKAHCKINSGKSLNRGSFVSQGAVAKTGLQQGDAEFILITSQLKISPAIQPTSHPAPSTPLIFSPGNTPRDASPPPTRDVPRNSPVIFSSISETDNNVGCIESSDSLVAQQTNSINLSAYENDSLESPTHKPHVKFDLPIKDNTGAATLSINIPTAEELSDRESPTLSPSQSSSAIFH